MRFSDLLNWAKKHKLHVWLVGGCRTLLACTFLFSALVKANDPVGFAIKLQEYATAVGVGVVSDLLLVGIAMAVAFVEIALAVSLAFGLNRRLTATVTTAFMSVMTLWTVWLAIENPVKDCGCFGDVLILTNTQTLLKNVLLLLASLVLTKWYRLQRRFIPSEYSWLVSLPATVGLLFFATWNVVHLPFVDFRPYYVGADLREAYETQSNRPRFDVKIIYQRGSQTLELEADDPDPDTTWHYVETRRIPIQSPMLSGFTTYLDHRMDVAEFSVSDAHGNDMTDEILQDTDYVFLLISPNLRTADQGCVGNINILNDDATAQGASFYCITASGLLSQDYWTDHTGAEYKYLHADRQLLETIVRSNPGLVLMHNGKIIQKWSSWNMPVEWKRP